MKYNQNIIDFLDQFLITVQKPGRYIGGEYNQIKKNWSDVDIKVALAFPDIYDIGFSNLGLAILYDIINSQQFALAERVYAPWIDFENLLREHKIPLFSLESKTPLRSFDLLGFSLPYETLYTNLINMLDLARIPIQASNRIEKDPIVIAGGHACFNPEPMHAFIDAFVIGEGEEIIIEILDQLATGKNNNLSRNKIIDSFTDIKGIYIPSHYQIAYTGINVKEIKKIKNPDKFLIQKRLVEQLPPPPTKLLVPNIQVVHDRVAVEIMRGCTRGCRFCQAGFINRPVRERSTKDLINTISETIKYTGYEEVALLSLSSSDYSKIKELIQEINLKSQSLNFSFSLPSLRIESFDDGLISMLKDKKKGNFTLAPEAASESIRKSINKPISDQDLLKTVEDIFKMGWRNIKLYFMIGFPSENIEDVLKISTVCRQVLGVGRKLIGNNVKIHISINAFIPKPHTPFQWAGLEERNSINEKFDLILKNLKGTRIKIDWSDYDSAFLEACLSRGDRRLSKVIETAWKNGCKFDSWHEKFNFENWMNAFESHHINPENYATEERSVNDPLPWDHIGTGVDKKFLAKEYQNSDLGILTKDCKYDCYACGIQCYVEQSCPNLRAIG